MIFHSDLTLFHPTGWAQTPTLRRFSRQLITLLITSSLTWLSPIAHSQTVQHRDLNDALAFLTDFQPDVETAQGTLSFAKMLDELKNKRVIYVGEIHTHYQDHLVQLAVLRHLHQTHPQLAIGVEWFQQDSQPWLDAYIRGEIGDADLLHLSDYYNRWRVDFRQLAPILHYARRHKLPMMALNAPSEITRQVSSQGFNSLSAAQQAQIPPITLPGEAQMQRLKDFFKDKIPPERNVEDFIYAQRIWDETMAYNAVQFLDTHPNHKLIVMAGSFHIARGEAIPLDVERQRPALAEQQATVAVGDLAQFKEHYVDYYVYAETLELPAYGRMGIVLNLESGESEIVSLIKDGAAEKAGLVVGDVIVTLNHQPMAHHADLMLALSQTQPGDKLTLGVQRQQHWLEFTLTLDQPKHQN